MPDMTKAGMGKVYNVEYSELKMSQQKYFAHALLSCMTRGTRRDLRVDPLTIFFIRKVGHAYYHSAVKYSPPVYLLHGHPVVLADMCLPTLPQLHHFCSASGCKSLTSS